MEIKFLGCYGGVPSAEIACSSFLVSNSSGSVLFECGSGVSMALQKYIDIKELKSIVVSHLHFDHFNDLLTLYYQYKVERPLEKLNIYLPATPKNTYDFLINNLSDIFNFIVINEFTKLILFDSFYVTFHKTQHDIETYAMRIEDETDKIGYTADTGYCHELVDFFKGVNTLIAESSLISELPENKNHMTSREAVNLAIECGVSYVLLTHFWYSIPVDTYLKEVEDLTDKVIVNYFKG